MIHDTRELRTRDGRCPLHTFRPDGAEPLPAAILVIDGFGPRDALFAIAERIAAHGFVIAMADHFYRAPPLVEFAASEGVARLTELVPKVLFDPAVRGRWREAYYGPATNPDNLRADLGAVLDALDARADVRAGSRAIFGYCMGGGMSLRGAAMFNDRIAAVASFHGGMLATDAPDSPHRLVDQLRAEALVIGAIEDPSFTDEHRERLEAALCAAHVRHQIETWPARHGFCISDVPTYDRTQAARHEEALLALLRRAL